MSVISFLFFCSPSHFNLGKRNNLQQKVYEVEALYVVLAECASQIVGQHDETEMTGIVATRAIRDARSMLIHSSDM